MKCLLMSEKKKKFQPKPLCAAMVGSCSSWNDGLLSLLSDVLFEINQCIREL